MFALLLLLIGLECVLSSPKPLVSSSGMVPALERSSDTGELLKTVKSDEKKLVLHPYVSNSHTIISIPTKIIVPTTTQSPIRRAILHTVVVPQAPGRTFVERARAKVDKNQPIDNSNSELGLAATVGNQSHVIVENSKVLFLDDNGSNNGSPDEVAASLRVARETPNDTVKAKKITNDDTTTLSSLDSDEDGDGKSDHYHLKLGPPWEDDSIVGTLIEDVMIDPIEVSFKVASSLCHKIARQDTLKPKRYYLWAPINQYVPLLRKAFPLRPPLFAPECLKFVLRQCRGTMRLPMFKPCTYWAPMIIRRPECGFNPNLQSKIVNYRLPEFTSSNNCPCVWPCTKRFDPIQRCRITINETEQTFDHIHSDGEPWPDKEIAIQENLAAQLCRGMKLALTVDSTIPIGWIPIRVGVDTNHNADEVDESAEKTRKKRSVGNTLKTKREQIFVNPNKQNYTSAEDEVEGDVAKDDRFTLMGTYNLDRQASQAGNETTNIVTTIRKCVVWKYKACPREDVSQEGEYGTAGSTRRKKRSIPSYVSRLALGLNLDENNNSFWGNRRFVRGAEMDDDELMFKGASAECSEWIKSESYRCIPEQHITHLPVSGDGSDSKEDSDKEDQFKKDVGSHRRKVVKDLCPGSVGKFPCFLRRKRSLASNNKNEPAATDFNFSQNMLSLQKSQRKREADDGTANEILDLRQSSMPYIINKIQTQPDASCMCEWPCLPFFDRVNQCYNSKGDVLLDELGRPKISGRSFRKTQRDPIVCLNFVEVDEIFCKIKV